MSWSKVLTVKAKSGINKNRFSLLADEENKAVMYHNKILHVVGGNKDMQVDPLDLKFTKLQSMDNENLRPRRHNLIVSIRLYITRDHLFTKNIIKLNGLSLNIGLHYTGYYNHFMSCPIVILHTH
ncbi:hypothetical protein YC2023_005131 [Brassica napus]